MRRLFHELDFEIEMIGVSSSDIIEEEEEDKEEEEAEMKGEEKILGGLEARKIKILRNTTVTHEAVLVYFVIC